MGTSLSYDFQFTNADKLIRDAFTKVGVNPSVISGLQYSTARNGLDFLFSSWMSKRGLNLFTIEQDMISIIPGQSTYALPSNTSKILECVYLSAQQQVFSTNIPTSYPNGSAANIFLASPATLSNACTQTTANGYVQCVFQTANPIQYIGILTTVTSTYQLSFQCSFVNTPVPADIITILNTPAMTYYAGQMQWFALPYTETAVTWRIQEIGGNTLNLRQVLLSVQQNSQKLDRVGRDEFIFNPATPETGTVAVYYVNRNSQPTLSLWNLPDKTWQYLLYNRVRSIQDAGYTNSFDMTPRFLEALAGGLAARLARDWAPERATDLQTRADQLFKEASTEDVENVNIQMSLGDVYGGSN